MKIAQYLAAASFVLTSATFAQPVITKLLSSGGSTAGGEFIYLMGTFPAGFPTVLIGGGSAAVLQSTTSSILCLTPPGVGSNLQVQVIFAGQPSNTVQYSYNMPRVLNINPATAPTAGATSIVITGTDFGSNPLVTIGGTTVPRIISTENSFTGLLPQGQGANLPVIVNVGGQTNLTTPTTFSYNLPSLTSFLAPTNPTQGGGVITLNGSNFGQSPQVRVGTQTTSVIAGTLTPTQLQFPMPAGAGANIPISLSVGGQLSNTLNISYSLPTITTVLPPNGPTAGGTEIELIGNNFGPDTSATILFDGQPVANSPTSIGHTSLKFLLPAGQGLSRTIRVNAGGQLSNQLTLNYDAPVLSSVEPSSVSVTGDDLLHLSGNNFGLNPVVLVNGAIAPVVSHTHTAITCRPPVQGPGIKQVVVVVGPGTSQPIDLLYTCPPDFNGDGAVDFFDYLDFVDAYSLAC